jgi:predicted AAA+ superfamily ATPase
VYERLLTRRIASAARSILLLGPRQVGKSTLLASLRPDLTVNLASPAAFRDYSAHPDRLEAELRAVPARVRTVLLDEVQRVPALFDVVQVLLDETPRRFRFLLSGSSARKLRRGQANLLPGRIHMHHLHPLLARELGDDFQLERVLAQGTLPGISAEPDPELRAADLRAYTDIYLREEVQAEALVRNIGGYSRLLDLAAAAPGRILNLRALSQDSGISYETARRYFEVLEDTLMLFRVPAWSGSTRGSLLAHPKIYLFDLGVRNALLRRPLDRPLEDERGLLLDHFVATELHRRLGTLWPQAALFHFRTRQGAEVDFVVQDGREIWGIEVKHARDVDRRSLRGFEALAEHTPALKRRIVIYLGPRRMKLADAEVIPLREFLDELPA